MMRKCSRHAVIASSFAQSIIAAGLFLPSSTFAADIGAVDIVEFAERYCINTDGDHRLTWDRAERDGFVWLSSDDFPEISLRTSVIANLRGLEKSIQGTTVRVFTSAYSHRNPHDGISYFRQCWVSASSPEYRSVNHALRNLLGFGHFRSQQTAIFAWIPLTDGRRRAVSKRDYMRRHLSMAREIGLRQVTMHSNRLSVSIGYGSPRDEATYLGFDWGGPEPVPAPR